MIQNKRDEKRDNYEIDPNSMFYSGLYSKEIEKYPVLNQSEERDLCDKIRKGDEKALEKLILSNLRLAINIAKNYRERGLPFSDIIQEGMVGLVGAAGKYDLEKGWRFSTYASKCIRRTIERALNKATMVKFPGYSKKKLGRDPNVGEVETDLRTREKKDEIIERARKARFSNNYLPLDELVISEISFEMEKKKNRREPAIDFENLLDSLTNREKEVVRIRYSFPNKEYTLEEVGEIFKVTRERIRQIEAKALEKIYREIRRRKIQLY